LIANLRGARPSNDLKLVLADSRTGRFRLAVPDLVVEETVNKRSSYRTQFTGLLARGTASLAVMPTDLHMQAV